MPRGSTACLPGISATPSESLEAAVAAANGELCWVSMVQRSQGGGLVA
jgi:hypothetical protein